MEEGKLLGRLLKKKLPEGELRQELEQMKIAATYGSAIWLQVVKKAAAGDLSAVKYVREAMAAPVETAVAEDGLRELSTEELRRMVGER